MSADIEQVTAWGELSCLAAYEERKRLDNSSDGYAYYVEEDHRSSLVPRYRIVRRRRAEGMVRS